MPLILHDTLRRQPHELAPKPGQPFRLYCCGPTVYGPAHLGNLKAFVNQDTLVRVLRLEFGERAVRHVRNITDVDDKTIRQSLLEGVDLRTFTERWTEKFHDDAEALNLLPPDVEPRATDHIEDQIAIIARLLEKGHAYRAPDGSVYFRVASFPAYGRLSRLQERTLVTQGQTIAGSGAPNLADEYERESAGDFALWKARKPEDGPNHWSAPWGEGRPGWHLECSAMSTKYLGPSFDLHAGGVDLIFPHHENEIAQSEAATGVAPFCGHWFHNAHLLVEGRKMSKSLGNFHTLADLQAQGHSPMAVRYLLVSANYRASLNATQEGLRGAAAALAKIERLARHLLERAGHGAPWAEAFQRAAGQPFNAPEGALAGAFAALRDDLNTAGALGELFTAAKALEAAPLAPEEAAREIRALGRLLYALGLRLFDAPAQPEPAGPPAEVMALAEARWAAKKARQFAEADRLRGELAARGWKALDRRDGYDLEPA